ncbi:MAG TPA: type II toxin-antitoxin system HipA family toxin [Dokdonella sp.]|uniref:type II toxin-antitoxin system HipA family toxin n=1 Tax=Dokdonella sp. TaxID=2291710 RepID=UPI002D7FE92D|nr:type II toxin-antitoxin system HipA family toxin [Dokdonella sp.]HET9033888.1 type II toxin-antitoxin system HipA family toxin [Dokdonella sp.]
MAARIRALDIWMNGHYVGRWERARSGADQLTYDREWIASPEGRPLSLSLPFTSSASGKAVPLSSAAVAAYFDNLLPDNDRILRRLRDRYGAASTSGFDLLATIGRDCAGAVQLVPAGSKPDDVRTIDAEPLSEGQVAQILRDTTLSGPFGQNDSEAFRLSIAGAQEKTALLRHEDQWCIPRRSTPSTHIFKLPLGLVGNMQADMRASVEIEWLSMEIAQAFGLPVARTEIGRFEDQKALIVERFDRFISSEGPWWMRAPQEDFCQALGMPPSMKYEADGGPGIRQIMEVLRGAEDAQGDRATFFKSQLLFWLMAATDGHAKNFSLQQLPGGAYRLTPLYDILSAYPILGSGNNRLDPRKAKLAMAVVDRNRHYDLHGIHRWHWVAMGAALGLPDVPALIETMIKQTPFVLDEIASRLPDEFPADVFDAIHAGMTTAIERLISEPDKREVSNQ